jgi:hypothetical protein
MKKNAHKDFVFLTLLFIAALNPFNILSQDTVQFQANWTEKLKVPVMQELLPLKMTEDYLLYKSWDMVNEVIAEYSFNLNTPHLYRVDLKTNQIIDKKISLENKDRKRALEKILYVNDSIYLISSFINESQKKYYLFAETVQGTNLELVGDIRTIAEIDYGVIEKAKVGTFYTSVSQERNRVLISTSLKTKTENLYFYTLLDDAFSKKADYRFQVNLPKSWVSASTVDYSDNLYLIETIYNGDVEPSNYNVHFLPKDNSGPKKQSVGGVNITSSLNMTVNKKDELICTGAYSRPYREAPVGVFSVIFPTHLSGGGKSHSIEFTDEMLFAGLNEKEVLDLQNKLKRKEDFNNGFNSIIKDLQVLDDGSFVFACERSKAERSTSSSSRNGMVMSSRYSFCFTYGDIYVFSCSADGSFKWQKKIARKQELWDVDAMLGSYLSYFDPDGNWIFIFNQIPETKLLKKGEAPKSIRVVYDADGNRKERSFFGNPEITKRFVPAFSKKMEGNKFLITLGEHSGVSVHYKVGLLEIQP